MSWSTRISEAVSGRVHRDAWDLGPAGPAGGTEPALAGDDDPSGEVGIPSGPDRLEHAAGPQASPPAGRAPHRRTSSAAGPGRRSGGRWGSGRRSGGPSGRRSSRRRPRVVPGGRARLGAADGPSALPPSRPASVSPSCAVSVSLRLITPPPSGRVVAGGARQQLGGQGGDRLGGGRLRLEQSDRLAGGDRQLEVGGDRDHRGEDRSP